MLVAQRPDISLSWNVWDSFSLCGSKAMRRFLFLHHLWTIRHPEEEDYNKFYRALAHNQHKLQTWHKCCGGICLKFILIVDNKEYYGGKNIIKDESSTVGTMNNEHEQ